MSHRKPASAGASRDSYGVQNRDKRYALYMIRCFKVTIKKENKNSANVDFIAEKHNVAHKQVYYELHQYLIYIAPTYFGYNV